MSQERKTISLGVFAGAILFYLLALILPVAEISEALVLFTTYENSSLTLSDRLTGLGMGLFFASLALAGWGAFNTYNGKNGLVPGILAFVVGFIPALAANDISDLTESDPSASTQFGATAIWLALLLALGGGLTSKFVEKE